MAISLAWWLRFAVAAGFLAVFIWGAFEDREWGVVSWALAVLAPLAAAITLLSLFWPNELWAFLFGLVAAGAAAVGLIGLVAGLARVVGGRQERPAAAGEPAGMRPGEPPARPYIYFALLLVAVLGVASWLGAERALVAVGS